MKTVRTWCLVFSATVSLSLYPGGQKVTVTFWFQQRVTQKQSIGVKKDNRLYLNVLSDTSPIYIVVVMPKTKSS